MKLHSGRGNANGTTFSESKIVVLLQESLGSLLLLRPLAQLYGSQISAILISSEVTPNKSGLKALIHLIRCGKGAFLVHRLWDRFLYQGLGMIRTLSGLNPPTSVKKTAKKHGIFCQCIKSTELSGSFNRFKPTIIISMYYNRIISSEVLAELGDVKIINVHPSLLPHHRGVFPDFWALYEGDSVSGTTVHLLSEGVDTGDILLQDRVAIEPTDTVLSLYYKCTVLARSMILKAIDGSRSKQTQADMGIIRGWPGYSELRNLHRNGRKTVNPLAHIKLVWKLLADEVDSIKT